MEYKFQNSVGYSGGTTGVQTVHHTGAHGQRGPIQAQTINRLHRSSQYNTINNYYGSLDFTQKCSQNAGNAIPETLNSKNVLAENPPDPLITLWRPKFFFSNRVPHPRSAATGWLSQY